MAGHLLDNVVGFGRLLRSAGLPIGPEQLERSTHAIQLAGLRRRSDFYWALAGTLVTRPEHQAVFDQAFELFWQAQLRTRPVAELSVWRRDDTASSQDPASEVPHSLLLQQLATEAADGEDDRSADQRDSAAQLERLTEKHFDQMSADELAIAKQKLRELPLNFAPYATRRRERDVNGDAIDWRRSFRSIALNHGGLPQFAYSSRRTQKPTIVLLCDISGSMQLYSRVLLHFACVLAQRYKRTYAFLFCTRLTDVSRFLGDTDIDRSVERICASTHDFDGGTRIGSTLSAFNKHWSRRLLSRHAIVVLVTDGLDSEGANVLDTQIDRLHRSCSHLMWLNPLLRYSGFQPLSSGVKTILRHVDSIHAVHNLRHVGDVAAALANAQRRAQLQPTGSQQSRLA